MKKEGELGVASGVLMLVCWVVFCFIMLGISRCEGPELRECRKQCFPYAPVSDNGRLFNEFDKGSVCYCDMNLVLPSDREEK